MDSDEISEVYRQLREFVDSPILIGYGSYFAAFKGQNRETREWRVFKVRRNFKWCGTGLPADILREVSILKMMKQGEGQLVKISNVMFRPMMIIEMDCYEGDLGQEIFRVKAMQSSDFFRTIVKDLLTALNYIHSRQIMHRDVKLENILIKDDRAFLADFGHARKVSLHDCLYTNKIGSWWYRSPELTAGLNAYAPNTDVWSAGVVAAELILGCNPFKMLALEARLDCESNDVETRSKVILCAQASAFGRARLSSFESFNGFKEALAVYGANINISETNQLEARLAPLLPQSALELLLQMLEPLPEKRIEAKEALSHRWLL